MWADGINYPPFSAMLHWTSLLRALTIFHVKSLRKWTPRHGSAQCYQLKKSYSGRTKVMLILVLKGTPAFQRNATLKKKLQGRRSNLLGIFLISGDSWIWHRLVIDISCCSCASSAWLITYPIFYHSGESLLKCYLPGMSATHRHTIAASPDFLRLKLWADGINYPPFSAMLHWKKLQRQDKSSVKSLRKGTPAFQRNATLKKATAAGQKLC